MLFIPCGSPAACLLPDKSLGMRYLEGQGDFVSRLIMLVIRVTIWVIGIINLLTKSP